MPELALLGQQFAQKNRHGDSLYSP